MRGAQQTLHQLPVFPLTGCLLLPGTFLPLNVFEQRYRNLVEDVLTGDRLLGMVQPRVPAADNYGGEEPETEAPALYDVGCVGRIQSWRGEPDGRFLIVLEGTSRFHSLGELDLHRGYRRVRARLVEDAGSDPGGESFDNAEILARALAYAERWEIDFDGDLLAALPGWRLVNALAAALPFRPEEQQLLLEAETGERARTLLSLMEMEGLPWSAEQGGEQALVN